MCIEMTSSNFIWEIQQLCGKQKAELAKKEQTKFNKNSFWNPEKNPKNSLCEAWLTGDFWAEKRN